MREEAEERELNKAREYATGRLLLRMEDSRAVASWMGSQQLLQNQLCSVEDIVSRLYDVTPADISAIATPSLSPGAAAPRRRRPPGRPENADRPAQTLTTKTPSRNREGVAKFQGSARRVAGQSNLRFLYSEDLKSAMRLPAMS